MIFSLRESGEQGDQREERKRGDREESEREQGDESVQQRSEAPSVSITPTMMDRDAISWKNRAGHPGIHAYVHI